MSKPVFLTSSMQVLIQINKSSQNNWKNIFNKSRNFVEYMHFYLWQPYLVKGEFCGLIVPGLSNLMLKMLGPM